MNRRLKDLSFRDLQILHRAIDDFIADDFIAMSSLTSAPCGCRAVSHDDGHGACPGRADAYGASACVREYACAVRRVDQKRHDYAGGAHRENEGERALLPHENVRARGAR